MSEKYAMTGEKIDVFRKHLVRSGYTRENICANQNGRLFTKLVITQTIPATLLVTADKATLHEVRFGCGVAVCVAS